MRLLSIVIVLIIGFAANTIAAEVAVKQKGRKFSEKKIELGVGGSIKFINDDDVTHNIHSTTKSHAFDIGAQKPGQTIAHTFNKAGKVKLRCAIHPKMKIKVTVK
jgi:plastocyanin